MISNFISVTGKKWALRDIEERKVDKLVQDLEISDFLARIACSRQEKLDSHLVERWLDPKLKSELPSPMLLKDMSKAVQRITDAFKYNQKIAILGDYDVDGATSSALLYRAFKMFGTEPIIYIPDRIKEGYGPNITALDKLKNVGAELIITVDCGTTAFDEIDYANKISLDVIVLDHHSPEAKLPNAFAVINPNRIDDSSGLGMLAAVGVAFMLAGAVKSHLIKENILGKNNSANLIRVLDLVALGTICDVVPLIGPNRALVKQGLRSMSQMNNLGIKMLFETSEIDDFPSVYHAGYVLGPRINAGGRVGQSNLGAKLLITDDINEAKNISVQLNNYNEERKKLELEVFTQARSMVNFEEDTEILILSAEKWHPGVIGIVASRIVEQFNKPAIIIAKCGDLSKGSARSVPGGLNPDLYKQLQKAEPYGSGNPEPCFIIQNASIFGSKVVGENHINCSISDSSKTRINGIAFRSVGTKLGKALLNKHNFHVIGKFKLSKWGGNERVQIYIEDLIEI